MLPETVSVVGEKLVAVRLVKFALVAKRLVEVAEVEVEFTVVKLVMVLEALLTRMPPERVARPETVSEVKVPTDVREEFKTEAPRVAALKTWALLMV